MELEAWLFPCLFNTPFLTVIILNSLNFNYHILPNQIANLNVMVWLFKNYWNHLLFPHLIFFKYPYLATNKICKNNS